jgi:hypothetical protein
MKSIKPVVLSLILLGFIVEMAFVSVTPASAAIPTTSIVSVVPDSKVTIQTYNFPAGMNFDVRMGLYGTQGINGVLVTTINSGSGGSFTATFDIPASLYGQYRIAIRLENLYYGYYAYDWFYNNTSGTAPTVTPGTGGPYPTSTPVYWWDYYGYYTGIPTFSIVSVARDSQVTIQTSNFPANMTFDVRMGLMGTRGVNGVLVTTINSGSGGSFTATYDIPASLQGQYKIAIRLENLYYGYYAYNWFYNNTTGVVATVTPGTGGPYPTSTPVNWWGYYSGIPTFNIVSVVSDSQVTIQTNNFPANMVFDVRMGEFGTQGINGVLVTTVNSGSGGSFTATYDIPASLYGLDRIAIRLENPYYGYYAYNWFYN